jgi:2-amino-4-deoxychorismate synthase
MPVTSGAIGKQLGDSTLLERLRDPQGPAFALLYRPQHGGRDRIEVLVGSARTVDRLADLPLPERSAPAALPRHDLLALIPYRQIHERGFACRDDGTPLVAMTVTDQRRMTVAEATEWLPDPPVRLDGAGFDVDDQTYAGIVRRVLAEEIGRGAGSNFVIKRNFVATIENFSRSTALGIFRRLLDVELGSYWTFVVHTGTRTLVGATPERHVSLMDGVAGMNPISGTYRYPPDGPSVPDVLGFLADQKESDELYMVLDEELKMMARICGHGGRVVGPFLKEMARLAHTEYLIEGHSDLDVRDILRETMFAPAVTGSPLENACRVITRYETSGRGYYSGALALIGRDANGRRNLDSAILIRTADIDDAGRMRIGVGATLVRHSVADSEVAETASKAAGLLAALDRAPEREPAPAGGRAGRAAVPPRIGGHPAVRRALEQRNATLSRFWLDRDRSVGGPVPELAGYRVLVIDAEDNFTAMFAHQLRSLGLAVTVQNYSEVGEVERSDLIVVGPGPGDPTDLTDPRIARLHAITRDLLGGRTPFLGVCLGHQVLADELGLELVRRRSPNQGVQRRIQLFGRAEWVGFYNTFAARGERDRVERDGVGTIELSRDAETGEIHAMRGPHFSSFQFHLESVLTERGVGILAEEVTSLLGVSRPPWIDRVLEGADHPGTAVVVVATTPGLTAEQYNRINHSIMARDSFRGLPPGCTAHIAGPTAGGWRVIAVWESEEAVRRFTSEVLRPMQAELGITPSPWPPVVFPLRALRR